MGDPIVTTKTRKTTIIKSQDMFETAHLEAEIVEGQRCGEPRIAIRFSTINDQELRNKDEVYSVVTALRKIADTVKGCAENLPEKHDEGRLLVDTNSKA